MLKEKLLEDLKEAMKEKDSIKKNTIQMARAAVLQVEKDKQIELQDSDILTILAKEVKKRKDSLSDYQKGGREDLVEQINKEIQVLEVYLPKQLSKEELEKELQEIVKKLNATSMKDMGIVMKTAKEKIGTRADGKEINEIVKKLLG